MLTLESIKDIVDGQKDRIKNTIHSDELFTTALCILAVDILMSANTADGNETHD